ncbi:MAG TPA: arsinothricin resistance N-acetyltransferase ArsN1 family B [Polyangiaceae bacterium]|nr:arsinothricin resistance N-acetyltransferase ArsN1 family B [Polyangiaceae bacterium]
MHRETSRAEPSASAAAASNVQIRFASSGDAAGIAAIYAPHVVESAISFEAEPPSAEMMRERIISTLAQLPWLVSERGGELLGYAYASPHSERAAYRWSLNASVYIAARCRRQGVGRALYTSLFALARLAGYYSVHAGVTLPNAASVGLHESFGFVPVGIYRAVGFKLNAWHDVGWWQLELRPRSDPPAPPLALPLLREQRSNEVEAALAAGRACL